MRAVSGVLTLTSFLFLFCLACQLEVADGKHYYFIPTYHKSHWGFQVQIARELSERGNEITFQLPLEFKESGELPTSDQVDFAKINYAPIGFTPEFMQETCKKLSEISVSDYKEMIKFSFDFIGAMSNGFTLTLNSFIEMINNGEKIDVLVGDLSPATMAACALYKDDYNLSCFQTSPFVLRNPDAEHFLGGNLPSWFPASFSGMGVATTMSERITQQIATRISKIIGYFFIPFMMRDITTILDTKNISQEQLYNLQPVIINTFQGLDWNIPLPPHVKFIGPANLKQIETTRDEFVTKHERYVELSQNNGDISLEFDELDIYMEENEDIIVVSFGKSVELSESQIHVIVDFARKISPTPVLWTLRKRHLNMLPDDNMPSNLRIETWVNLIGVLSHVHTNLLISQCGVATAHEAILTQTPLLCVPFLFDQFDISVLVQFHNLGDNLEKEKLTPDNLYEKVVGMIPQKQVFQDNAAKLLKLAKLRPEIPEVVDW
eukprot:CAMPEP_0117010600 /NCGR_PEP_ID=MMETSP0472-20121206/9303_1 /TAXON_ID=693140 ORGANISM="Tiarina fusus, Strain LIS" /NCGR_SAMPLE_ID=MMETSP0472 /ASSEMBLY_ACC=CAM_ASM_000603 /LENGTH=491 /DNA_ID=CAMNT_0004713177 /DNA_START=23 /DNA_END=1495 /DNA_ORIENTATION=+